MRRQNLKRMTLVVVLALVAAACGGGTKSTGLPTNTPTTSPSPTQSASGSLVILGDNFFQPKELTVKLGTTVTWRDDGLQPHSVTADDGSFDSNPKCPSGPCLQKGATFTFTFTKSGRYVYYCKVHGAKGGIGMSGDIVVQ